MEQAHRYLLITYSISLMEMMQTHGCALSLLVKPLSLSLSNTHTQTHTQKKEREIEKSNSIALKLLHGSIQARYSNWHLSQPIPHTDTPLWPWNTPCLNRDSVTRCVCCYCGKRAPICKRMVFNQL